MEKYGPENFKSSIESSQDPAIEKVKDVRKKIEEAYPGILKMCQELIEQHRLHLHPSIFSAEEVANTVMAAALKSAPTFRDSGEFDFWIRAITKNVFKRHWTVWNKRKSKEIQEEEIENLQEDEGETGGGEDAVIRKLTAHKLIEGTDLTPNQKKILSLHYIEGMSTKEIAQQLEIHPDAPRRYLLRGRRRLGVILKEQGKLAGKPKVKEPPKVESKAAAKPRSEESSKVERLPRRRPRESLLKILESFPGSEKDKALSRLNAHQRQAVVLLCFENLDAEQISRRLNVPRKKIHGYLYEAFLRLKNQQKKNNQRLNSGIKIPLGELLAPEGSREKLLARLKPLQRQIVEWYQFEGLSFEQIAQKLEMNDPRQVRVRLRLALRSLRASSKPENKEAPRLKRKIEKLFGEIKNSDWILGQLTPEYREVVSFLLFEGLDPGQVAERLKLPPEKVEHLMFCIFQDLRRIRRRKSQEKSEDR